MKPKFLLETGAHSERLEEFHEICKSLDLQCEFAENNILCPDSHNRYSDNDCVCAFGTLYFIKKIQSKTSYLPGSYACLPNFKVSSYINYYYKHMFNLGVFAPINYFVNNIPQFMRALGITDGRFFIRPDGGDKQFTGCTLRMSDSRSIDYLVSRAGLSTMSYICPAQDVHNEYRLFMSGDKVITGSQYKKDGDIVHGPVGDRIVAAAESFAKGNWYPDPLWVMDIHEDADGVPTVMELNSWSCSGWYQSDLRKIILATQEQMVKDYKEIND